MPKLINRMMIAVAMIALTIWGMEMDKPGEGSSLTIGRAKMRYSRIRRPITPATSFTTGRSKIREALNICTTAFSFYPKAALCVL
jgi:hypothetical protein